MPLRTPRLPWCRRTWLRNGPREAIQTIPGIRVFMVDDLRNFGDPKIPHGVNEVSLQGKQIVRKGIRTSLTEMKLRNNYSSARKR
jgi:hypothetical protein